MENYQYIKVPNSISLNDYIENDYCLAPSKYSRFFPNKEVQFKTLAELCTESIKKLKVITKHKYHYSEIGDINVSDGSIKSTLYYGLNIPTENPKEILENDILISMVRTYRGGVGFVYENKENHCSTPAVLVIRDVSPIITKEYLFAVLRTNFFIEQILGFQNRGMYPRLDKDAMNHILIPIPKNDTVIKFITVLVKAYLRKLSLIKERHEAILKTIETELLENQKPNKFSFELPRINELEKVGRLDTSMYSYDYRILKHKLINYTNGSKSFFNLNDRRINFKKGPNLAISVIGQSIYSDKGYAAFYQLLLSKNFTKYNTLVKKEYIGNTVNLPLIQKGDFLFSCRGDMGRILLMIDEPPKSTTNFDCAIVSFPNQELYKTIFITQFLGYLREKKYVSKIAITGSGADSFTKYQFDLLDIPNFPESKQKEIALHYHNAKIDYKAETFTLANFLEKDNEFNQQAGIYELDKTAKQLKEILNQTIDNIINDKEIEIKFNL